MSGLKQVRDQLQGEWSRLQHRWQRTADQWRDVVRDRFEREYWQDYERIPPLVLREMDRLAELIAQARREVK